MNYGEILGKAWRITWKHKGLWVLGILAGCSASRGGGGGGGGGGSGANFSPGTDSGELDHFGRQFQDFPLLQQLADIPSGVWIAIAVGLALFFILLAIVFWVLGSIGKAGLFGGFNQADESGETTLREAFSFGLKNFWKILVIELIVGLASFILAMVILLPIIGISILTMGIGLLCLFPIFLIFIPVSLALTVLLLLIQIAVTADEVSLTDSPKHVWGLVKTAPWSTIFMTLILGVINLLISMLLVLPVFFMISPALVGGIIDPENMLLPGIAASVILLLLYAPAAVVVNGILHTYLNGSWTLFYNRLKNQAAFKLEMSGD